MDLGWLTELSPAVHFAARSNARPGEIWGPRHIPDVQLFYVVSGEVGLQLGPDRYRLLPGQCALYGNTAPHALTVIEPTDYFSFHFNWVSESATPVHPAYGLRDATEEHMRTMRAAPFRVRLPGGEAIALPQCFSLVGVESLMTKVVAEYRQEALAYPLVLRGLWMEWIAETVRQLTKTRAGVTISKVEPALQAIRYDPSRPWSVTELARLCGYHPSYFTEVFSEETGLKPKAYLTAERIKQAKQALLRGQTAESVAQSLGYASIHYFCNQFKKQTGLTPGEFRQHPKQSRNPEK